MRIRPVTTVPNGLPRAFAIAAATLLLAGCAAPQAPTPAPIAVSADDYRRAFEAAVDSLRWHGFVIDRQDYRFGVITTHPAISPSMFELWNRDNTTTAQSIASTAGDLQRIVTLKLDPQGDAAGPAPMYDLTAHVMLERKTDPLRKLTGSTDGFAITRNLDTLPEQYKRQGVTEAGYVEVERDPYFEERLLSDIRTRLATPVATEAPPTE